MVARLGRLVKDRGCLVVWDQSRSHYSSSVLSVNQGFGLFSKLVRGKTRQLVENTAKVLLVFESDLAGNPLDATVRAAEQFFRLTDTKAVQVIPWGKTQFLLEQAAHMHQRIPAALQQFVHLQPFIQVCMNPVNNMGNMQRHALPC